jgi:hypothetical protein
MSYTLKITSTVPGKGLDRVFSFQKPVRTTEHHAEREPRF